MRLRLKNIPLVGSLYTASLPRAAVPTGQSWASLATHPWAKRFLSAQLTPEGVAGVISLGSPAVLSAPLFGPT